MTESQESSLTPMTSRKFWLGASVLAAIFYLSAKLIGKLSSLLEEEHLNEAVYERLVSVLISTDAMLIAFLIGLYWGINVWQKGMYLKSGGEK